MPTAIIVAGIPTSTSRYGPIDGWGESVSREARYSQPTGTPIQSRSEPTTHCERQGTDFITIVDYAAGEPFIRLESTPTRNGNGYGPAFNYVNLSTLEAARRLAVKRAEASKKRDAKKFVKPEAA